MKIKILSFLLLGFGFYQIQAQTARVQVIHNAADVAASQVDVYLGSTLLINDFEFRTASSFINAPAGIPIHIGIAPGNSNSAADTIVSFTYTLVDGETYVIVANGIVSPTGYTPATAFNLDVYMMSQESAGNPNQTDVLVYHGVTDAPQVDVVVPDAGTVVNNIAYAEFQGYLNLPTADYTLNVTLPGGTPVIASYQAPLQTLGLEGEALVVLASGFLDPSVNNNGSAFGLWVALPAGGQLVELPSNSLSIKENNLNASFLVYPNPTAAELNVSFDAELSQVTEINLLDMTGKVVYQEKRNATSGMNHLKLDVQHIQSGLYILQVNSGNSTFIQKVQVSK
jgi:hypothetical protein